MSTPGPEPTVTDEELISCVRHHEYPVVSRSIVAEEVGISHERARVRLERLQEQGIIKKAKLNDNAIVYWTED